ncbi:unnamed protein product [Moneuplotes crassus]|uniref:Uncharacterized protein n=1 Tax=Euplotes crassus TaxID=5936 RepID=A0AAD1XED5_EUPCR|nr:unnamed protein product [Moneuplotes crassus]
MVKGTNCKSLNKCNKDVSKCCSKHKSSACRCVCFSRTESRATNWESISKTDIENFTSSFTSEEGNPSSVQNDRSSILERHTSSSDPLEAISLQPNMDEFVDYNKSDNVEEELTLQEEIKDRENALEELTSILGGSSSCPSFAPSVKFERPGCIPKFNHKRSSRMNFTGIFRKPERASFNLYSSLSSHKKDSSGMYF